jgi:hypothetical protein
MIYGVFYCLRKSGVFRNSCGGSATYRAGYVVLLGLLVFFRGAAELTPGGCQKTISE